ncbi:MAG TPA: cellulase family glycosylhydrolase [Holophaga sp.]|nr:cellulase family glycosylhydrolase [Holophaga sp.]
MQGIDRILAAAAVLAACLGSGRAGAAEPMAFWEGRPRKGANLFDAAPPSAATLEAARGLGIQWIRLAWDKWPGAGRDFLLGSADGYRGLPAADLQVLRAALDRAQAAGLKVVVVPLSLPGLRWRQNNGGAFDGRLWRDRRWWDQAAAFWRDLAFELKGHPALVAYNLINEPAPEREAGVAEDAGAETLVAWYRRIQGTPRDLPALYAHLVRVIREVDPATPIMVDAGWYARPTALAYWPGPLADSRTLYAFHMYEPHAWSSPARARGPAAFRYPGRIPGDKGRPVRWDRAALARVLRPAYRWAQAQGIPPGRLVAGEFGCCRRAPGAAAWLEDLLTILEAEGTHWAFYAFREAFDGFDYELGDRRLPEAHWKAREEGREPALDRGANPVFEPILRRLMEREPAPLR